MRRSCVVLSPLPAPHGTLRVCGALRARGWEARALHPAQLPPARGRDGPALAIARLASGCPPRWLWTPRLAEDDGLPFLNRPSRLALVHDKPVLLAHLAAAGLPVPPTVCVQRGAEVDLDALSGERFVVKPAQGAAGRGVNLGLSRARALQCARAFAEVSGPALVQPLLGAGVDRRMLFVAGELVASFERRPGAPDGRANLHYGGQPRAWAPDARDVELGRAALAVVQLDVVAIDLLATPEGPVLLEVNACPGLAGIEAGTGVDVADAIARAADARLAAV